MKSFMASSSGSDRPDKFLSYMVPSVGEVRGDDADDPTTYLLAFGDSEAKYLTLPTRLLLRKNRAREGKSIDAVEYFPVPKTVTVRNRSTVSARESKDAEDYVASTGRFGADGKSVHHTDADDHYSGAEDYFSD